MSYRRHQMARLLIRKTAWRMDGMEHREVERRLSDKVSMCNYWANRLVCEAANRAMQAHGGIGCSRHNAFEHIYRRDLLTEGSDEIEMGRRGLPQRAGDDHACGPSVSFPDSYRIFLSRGSR